MDLFTRYVLENPYPTGVMMLAVGAGLAWTTLGAEDRRRLIVAGVVATVGAAILGIGAIVVTPGEHARRVVLEVVDAAVQADIPRATAAFADAAVLSMGSPSNPGYPRDSISQRLEGLAGRYRIASNRITSLESSTESRQRGVVRLACRTELQLGFGPVPTSWVVQVERQPDGTWKISRVTWLKLASRTPPERW